MTNSKRTKIVCTIGPSCRSLDSLRQMIQAGMNVARQNFSHGTHSDHLILMRNIRTAAKSLHEPVAILQDLQGPKIRLGELPESGVELKPNKEIIFNTGISEAVFGKVPMLPVTYKNLHKDVKKSHRILIEDGIYEVLVTKVDGKNIHARVKNGGVVTSHKGMNFPDTTLNVSAITEKDKLDLAFGVKNGFDWVALSFVTSANDIKQLRTLIKKHLKKGQTPPRIIAKIEKHEALDNFDEILKEVDAIMVARGDLGVETSAAEVPLRQKEIIQKCRMSGKPVVVATQMLDSMIRNPRPTRAEISDVANAIIDHTDGVMLSGETATGKYPIEAVKFMAEIAEETEQSPFDDLPVESDTFACTDVVLSHTLHVLAAKGYIDGILTSTFLAPSAEFLNVCRPETAIFIASDNQTAVRQMNIRWSVKPFYLKKVTSASFAKSAMSELKKHGLVKKGMKLAIVLGGEKGVAFDIIEV